MPNTELSHFNAVMHLIEECRKNSLRGFEVQWRQNKNQIFFGKDSERKEIVESLKQLANYHEQEIAAQSQPIQANYPELAFVYLSIGEIYQSLQQYNETYQACVQAYNCVKKSAILFPRISWEIAVKFFDISDHFPNNMIIGNNCYLLALEIFENFCSGEDVYQYLAECYLRLAKNQIKMLQTTGGYDLKQSLKLVFPLLLRAYHNYKQYYKGGAAASAPISKEYLRLGKYFQELQQTEYAISCFKMIIKRYPEDEPFADLTEVCLSLAELVPYGKTVFRLLAEFFTGGPPFKPGDKTKINLFLAEIDRFLNDLIGLSDTAWEQTLFIIKLIEEAIQILLDDIQETEDSQDSVEDGSDTEEDKNVVEDILAVCLEKLQDSYGVEDASQADSEDFLPSSPAVLQSDSNSHSAHNVTQQVSSAEYLTITELHQQHEKIKTLETTRRRLQAKFMALQQPPKRQAKAATSSIVPPVYSTFSLTLFSSAKVPSARRLNSSEDGVQKTIKGYILELERGGNLRSVFLRIANNLPYGKDIFLLLAGFYTKPPLPINFKATIASFPWVIDRFIKKLAHADRKQALAIVELIEKAIQVLLVAMPDTIEDISAATGMLLDCLEKLQSYYVDDSIQDDSKQVSDSSSKKITPISYMTVAEFQQRQKRIETLGVDIKQLNAKVTALQAVKQQTTAAVNPPATPVDSATPPNLFSP